MPTHIVVDRGKVAPVSEDEVRRRGEAFDPLRQKIKQAVTVEANKKPRS